jgi:hypothetical protein
MRILGLLRADEASEAGEFGDPEIFERMGTFMEEVSKAGVLLGTDGLKPSSEGKRISLADGKVTVTDGPFTESKELVASYALFQVENWDDAIYWTTRFLQVLGSGDVELRPIYEASDFPAEFTPELHAQEDAWRQQMERTAQQQQQ